MRTVIVLLSFAAFATACSDEAPSTSAAPTLKVIKRVELNAPAAEVWQRLDDFNALHRWLPTIAKTEIIRGKNNKPGAIRLLTLKAGGTVEQELLAYDPAEMSYTYRIIRGVLPVSHYRSTVKVESLGNDRSRVTWAGEFKRKDTGPNPAQGADDEAAIKAVEFPYQAGLKNLKNITE